MREGDSDLTTQHSGEPLGERIIVSGRAPGKRRPARAQRADRDLAGQCRRPLPASRRPVLGAARPELHGRRPRPTMTRAATASSRRAAPTVEDHRNAWWPAHIHLFGLRWDIDRAARNGAGFRGDPLLRLRPDPPVGGDQVVSGRIRLCCATGRAARARRHGHGGNSAGYIGGLYCRPRLTGCHDGAPSKGAIGLS